LHNYRIEMLIFNDVYIDERIITHHFCCDLIGCKGQCCVEGELGAPVLSHEIDEIEKNYTSILTYIPTKNIRVIEDKGIFEAYRGDLYLQTVLGRECVFAITDKNGIVTCAIEKAYNENKSEFLKPISCHLFPIRIRRQNGLDKLEYMQIPECKSARELGEKQQLPVYKFLKNPLSRHYGRHWAEGFEAYCEFQYQKAFSD